MTCEQGRSSRISFSLRDPGWRPSSGWGGGHCSLLPGTGLDLVGIFVGIWDSWEWDGRMEVVSVERRTGN